MKIDGAINPELMKMLQTADISNLKPGDVLRAKVISLASEKMLLQLLDGSILTAASDSEGTYTQGMSLDLVVKEKNNGQLLVQVQNNENTVKMAEVQNEVIKLGLPDKEIVKQVITQLMNEGIKPHAELVQNVIGLLKGNPQLKLPEALFLIQNQMQSKPEMVKFLLNITKGEFQIQQSLEQISQVLLQQPDNDLVAAVAKQIQMLSLAEELISSDIMGSEVLPDGKAQVLPQPEIKLLFDALEQAGIKIPIEVLNKDMPEIIKAAVNEDKNLVQVIKDFYPIETKLPAKAFRLPNKIEDIFSVFKEKISEDADNSVKTREQAESIIKNAVEKLSVRVSVLQNEKVDIKNLEISKIYNSIEKFTRILEDELDHSQMESKGVIMESVHNIQSGLRFSQDILSYETFVQIPMQMNNQKMTGELYIMQNKKKRGKINPRDFTLFLSLTTENLGQVDSLVHVTNKYVTLNLRMENKGLFVLAHQYHKSLYEGLRETGYELTDLNIDLIVEKTNILNVQMETKKYLARYNRQIDYKI